MLRCTALVILAATALQDGPTPAQRVHRRIAPSFSRPQDVDAETLAAARTSPFFGARYAAALVQLHKSAEKGTDWEAAWLAISTLGTQGGPAGAPEHLKALAAALKDAVYCKACSSGRITCKRCEGKKTIDLPCPSCQGKGRFRRKGDGVGSDMLCPKCSGRKTFQPFPCPECNQKGTTPCGECRGRPWFDKCVAAGCEFGKIPCPTCEGDGIAILDCKDCEGKGRKPTKNPGFTIRCDACNQTGKLPKECADCNKTGRLPCLACEKTGRGAKPIELGKVFTLERCEACGGRGWPDEKGPACAKCAGLGMRLAPAGETPRMLD